MRSASHYFWPRGHGCPHHAPIYIILCVLLEMCETFLYSDEKSTKGLFCRRLSGHFFAFLGASVARVHTGFAYFVFFGVFLASIFAITAGIHRHLGQWR